MLQAFYTGLAGLNTFSSNLNNVSNNIANMNTPGYRGMDSFYQALGGDGKTEGFGVKISGLGYRFATGEIRQTGNDYDVAISGNGFFALMDGDKVYYSRSGRFDFNEEQVLIDRNTGFKVAAIDDNGQLQEINLSSFQSVKPTATSEIRLTGNLSPQEAEHLINNVKVINTLGEEVSVRLRFTNESAIVPNQWKVEILDNTGGILHTDQIKFGADGTPEVGQGVVTFNLTDSAGASTAVDLIVGSFGDFSAVTQTGVTGSTSNALVKSIDGKNTGELLTRSINELGQISLLYNNGDAAKPFTLAIADFDNLQSLEVLSGTVFDAKDKAGRVLGQAGEGRFKRLATNSIEMSNVDLSQEFGDMLVIQRGYQASSRILNVANQLLEQLYDNTRGR